MHILFIHQNFPAQFRFVSEALAKKGHDVRALGISAKAVPNVMVMNYVVNKQNTPNIHPLLIEFETKVTRGEACMLALLKLKNDGYKPDLIVSHPGWGESIFAKDVFPDAILLNYVEFFYRNDTDIIFDPEYRPDDLTGRVQMRIKNANNLINLDAMDAGLSPTRWQFSTMPQIYQDKVKVIFDGVNTNIVKPQKREALNIKLPENKEITLKAGDEIVTYVSRNLEPYRGYHSFMRSLPKLMKARPEAKIIIVGDNKTSYGKEPPIGQTWQRIFLDEIKDQVDLERIFFLGPIAYEAYLAILQISSVHIYLTYPFVMSWSAIEAMSCGCLMVGSNTEPVKEFIQHQKNGLLVDFFNYDEIADTLIEALAHNKKYDHLRIAARNTVIKNYDLESVSLPKQIKYFESLVKN
jgi:glycosyltransferase involved in cell wall biosynthesis